MKNKAGERLKAIRELMGITREDFAKNLQLDFMRLRNIEQCKIRMAEEEFYKIGEAFPEIMPWLTYEGEIKIQTLKDSDSSIIKLIAAKIEAGQIPKGFDLKDKIK